MTADAFFALKFEGKASDGQSEGSQKLEQKSTEHEESKEAEFVNNFKSSFV